MASTAFLYSKFKLSTLLSISKRLPTDPSGAYRNVANALSESESRSGLS